MRIVLERGSSTAMIRAPPTRRRKTIDGRGNRGRVMRKVIEHRDAVDLTAHFQPAAYASEATERCHRFARRNTCVARSDDRAQRVLHVVRADQRPVYEAVRFAVLEHLKT